MNREASSQEKRSSVERSLSRWGLPLFPLGGAHSHEDEPAICRTQMPIADVERLVSMYLTVELAVSRASLTSVSDESILAALEFFKNVDLSKRSPGFNLFRSKEHLDDTLQGLHSEELSRNLQNEESKDFAKRALNYFALERYGDAESGFHDAIRISPRFLRAYSNLASYI